MAKKMLCAVDDTEHSKAAVALAAQMATAMGAEAHAAGRQSADGRLRQRRSSIQLSLG